MNALTLVLIQHSLSRQLHAKVDLFLVSILYLSKIAQLIASDVVARLSVLNAKIRLFLTNPNVLILVLSECFSPLVHVRVNLFSVAVSLYPIDCQSACSQCTSISLCTECTNPFALYGSHCLTSCPKTMFNSNNVCKGF